MPTLFTQPQARDLLTEQLSESQRHLVMHKLAAEEHNSYVDMLGKRITRIQADLASQPKERTRE